MTLNRTIAALKRRQRVKILEKENPTYNVIVIAHNLSKDFLDEMRSRKELADIKSKYPPGFETRMESSLPANSMIFMQDSAVVAAWIGGKLKLITRKK